MYKEIRIFMYKFLTLSKINVNTTNEMSDISATTAKKKKVQ